MSKEGIPMWMRRCGQCGRELRKSSLAETFKGLCGFIWG